MTEYAKLVISVDSTQAAKARTELDKLPGAAGKAESAAAKMGVTFARVGGVVASALSVREVIRAADQYANLTNRLRLVTTTSEQLAYAQQAVMRSALETYQPLETTAEVYQRIAQNASALGLSFEEVEAVTKTVSRTIALSGADSQAAAGAMRQFGQALASGALRGDELNSILEGTPALAQAIARGLGVSTGELRKMGAEGALTADKVIKGLQQQEIQVEEMAKTMNVTAGQAMVTFGNSLVGIVGKLDDASGASRGFASAVLDLSGAMNRFSSGEFMDFFRDSKQTAEGFNSEISVTLSQIRDLQDARRRLDKDDPGDTVLFKFKLWNKEELDAEISGLNGQVQRFQKARDRLIELANKPGQETPKDGGNGTPTITPPATVTDNATKALERQISALTQQATTLGMTAEQAELYALAQQGATTAQLKQAEVALSAISAYEEQADRQGAYADLLRELQTDEERLTTQMRERLAVLDAISGLSQEERDRVAGRIASKAIADAPEFGGLAPEVGGVQGELDKIAEAEQALQVWYETQLQMLGQYRQERSDLNARWDAEEQAVHEQHQSRIADIERARQLTQLAANEAFFSNLTGLTGVFAGEQSSAYKAMFALEKGYALAKVLMNAPKTASDAYSAMAGIPYVGPALGVAAAAAALSFQAAQASGISSINLSGMAHDGIDSVPREGTWLLDKGERVVDRRTNADLKEYLASDERSSSTPNIQIINNGEPVKARAEMDGKTMKIILDRVQSEFTSSLHGEGAYHKAISGKYGLQTRGI